jgi:hypothetical protein
LSLFSERSEYALITNTEQHRRSLLDQRIPFAECEGALVVVGNSAEKAQWLSRVPRTPLLVDGNVPADDPPARQMLSVLTEAILPPFPGERNLCVLTIPGLRDGSEQSVKNEEFLCRLVRMRGYQTLVVNPAEAALLASCSDASFTGISIVMGAETTTICISRYGMPLITETIAIGGNWMDTEIARQFHVQVWDEEGNSYLDIERHLLIANASCHACIRSYWIGWRGRCLRCCLPRPFATRFSVSGCRSCCPAVRR